jgi:alpha-ketoglutarate-dependent 2,4-dichlorophenoxyacetate dioxygenase
VFNRSAGRAWRIDVKIAEVVPGFVGEATNVILSRGGSDDLGAQIRAALDTHPVLIFRNQDLTDADQLSFAARLGRVRRVGGVPYIGTSGNVDDDGRILTTRDDRQRTAVASRLWHSDVPYKRIPDRYTVLVSHVLPRSGGNTQFSNGYAAWETLDKQTRDRVEDLVAVHDRAIQHQRIGFTTTDEERAEDPPTPQPLVLTNPHTGRKSLYLASDISGIIGMSTRAAMDLISRLITHATDSRLVYEVEWQDPGTLVVWDNRATMHRGMPYPETSEPRLLRRCAVVSPGGV